MKITIESTDKVVDITPDMRQGRVWEGTTEGGIKCFLIIPRVAVKADQDNSQFEKELTEHTPKPWDKGIDIRLII